MFSLFKKKYIELPLDIMSRGNGEFQYFINVFSGEKRLYMLVDSGATCCYIKESSLDGCHYALDTQEIHSMTAGGSIKKGTATLLSLCVADCKKGKKYYQTLGFITIPDNAFPPLDNISIGGIIGSNFLQSCSIDFLHGSARIYL